MQVWTPPSVSTRSTSGVWVGWTCFSWPLRTWKEWGCIRSDTRSSFWRPWRNSALWWGTDAAGFLQNAHSATFPSNKIGCPWTSKTILMESILHFFYLLPFSEFKTVAKISLFVMLQRAVSLWKHLHLPLPCFILLKTHRSILLSVTIGRTL